MPLCQNTSLCRQQKAVAYMPAIIGLPVGCLSCARITKLSQIIAAKKTTINMALSQVTDAIQTSVSHIQVQVQYMPRL